MATFSAKKLDITKVNGGQEYEQGDFLQSDTINDIVEGTAYAQNVAEAANTTSNKAVSTANSANDTANAASEKVDKFDERITTAQNKANTAYDNAATAQSTADNATTEINKIKNGTTVVPNANHANNADNANLATKAQQDVNGNPINTTYATVEYVDDLVTEKQGTRVTVNNANVAELSFTSDPQTQITANKNAIAEAQSNINNIISGAQTVGKATQDANGNVIDETYSKLSQVVRVDAAQTLNDGQKQIARNNVTTFISKGLPSAGWYRIAELVTSGFFEFQFNSVYYATPSSTCKVFVSLGAQYTDKYSLTSINSNSASPVVQSVRLIAIENKWYVDFYYNGTYSQDVIGIVMSGVSYNDAFAQITPIDFTPVDNTGTVLTSLDITAGINTTGGVYQNGSPVFATDPSKLAPSTANGWTQTTATGSLPSAGVYMISFDEENNATISTGVLFFDGQNVAQTVTAASMIAVVTILYHHTGSTKWRVAFNANQLNLTSVYYKRIA